MADKKVTGFVKLQIPAGAANPAPPVGPALGAQGVKGRAYRRGRIGSAGGDLQLYKSSDFLVSHL